MTTQRIEQGIITVLEYETYIPILIDSFIIDRRAQNLSKGTIRFYQKKLKYFTDFCDSQAVNDLLQIDANLIRQFLLHLGESGHNPGGIHAMYRSLKTFLRWWENEFEPDDWKNPINKVKAPRVSIEPLEPVDYEVVKAMITICPMNFTGLRDKAMMLFLLDTGVRASELISVNIEDLNPITGDVLIKIGKGRKPRTVYIGSKSRKVLRAYLKVRKDNSLALWVTDEGEPITYWGVRMMIRRRANQAGVKPPKLHAFRRWFALTCLRAGMDVYSLQELMGHADLQILRRYLKQTNQDIREAHRKASPVDNGL
ncbi:tyrosine-type recombinase/integrase [Chloroflexota bacterium]